jgi:hypothetical protein
MSKQHLGMAILWIKNIQDLSPMIVLSNSPRSTMTEAGGETLKEQSDTPVWRERSLLFQNAVIR